MRVRSKKSFNLLQSLGLDQPSFGLARQLVYHTEKLQALQQGLKFLRRCKKHRLTPNCVRHSFEPPVSLTSTPTLRNLLTTTRQKLLTLLIRDKYSDIKHTRQNITELRTTIPPDILTQLQRPIYIARTETKHNSKTRLKRKFNELQNEHQQRQTDVNPTPTHTAKTDRTTTDSQLDTDSQRVTIIGDIDIPQPALTTLAKGPGFVLTTKIPTERLQRELQVQTANLAYHMRWHYTMKRTNTPASPTLDAICPSGFRNQRTEPPRTHKETEKAIQGFQTDLQQLIRKHNVAKTKRNTTSTERRAIIALKSTPDVTITKSDKGGEMVVMRTSQLQKLCLEHLGDTTTYEKLKKDPTNSIRITINKNLERILTARGFSTSLIRNLQTPSTAKTQHFYALPKTHKKTLKIRPIVSACGGIFDRLGWLLQSILKPLLKQVSAHLNSTTDLLQRFNNIDKTALKGMIPISFDVVSLYTNIDTNEAIDTTLQYAIKHNLYLHRLETYDLLDLLHLLLDNNIFTYDNFGLYKQIRGLAMGNRLSGTLAILCMDRFETMHIYQNLQPPLTIYVRYVDDAGTVTPTTEQATTTLTYLNSKHPTIKFEMELPDTDGYLPILDIKLNIDEDGNLHHKLYSKPASKGIMLHFRSHHPSSVKRAVIANEFRRAELCSSAEHRSDAFYATQTKLTSNAYPQNWTKPPRTHKRKKTPSQPTLFNFNIPFIDDKFNSDIKRLLTKHNIPARLTNKRGLTLRSLTKTTPARKTTCKSKSCPAPGICQRSSVVYEVTCTICGKTYIGMTTRKLHERAREHTTAAREHSASSALGDHYHDVHPDATPSLHFTILAQDRDVLNLHIREAYAIQERQPSLNRRDEHLGTGFLV